MRYDLKGLYRGFFRGVIIGVTEGDTRSLDYSSYAHNAIFYASDSQ